MSSWPAGSKRPDESWQLYQHCCKKRPLHNQNQMWSRKKARDQKQRGTLLTKRVVTLGGRFPIQRMRSRWTLVLISVLISSDVNGGPQQVKVGMKLGAVLTRGRGEADVFRSSLHQCFAIICTKIVENVLSMCFQEYGKSEMRWPNRRVGEI